MDLTCHEASPDTRVSTWVEVRDEHWCKDETYEDTVEPYPNW